jgi:hypothetical protein
MRPFCSALSPGLLSRTVVRSDLFFTKLVEPGENVLGRVQLGAGEGVIVVIQSAEDQHLAVGEQGRRQVRTRDVQAAGQCLGARARGQSWGGRQHGERSQDEHDEQTRAYAC